jgi:hypothetical protein
MLRTKDQSAFGKDFTNSLGLGFMTIDNNGRRDAAEQWPNPFKKKPEPLSAAIEKDGERDQLIPPVFVYPDNRKKGQTEMVCARRIVHDEDTDARGCPRQVLIEEITTSECARGRIGEG